MVALANNSADNFSNLPNHGVQVAGRFRMPPGVHAEQKKARNFGPERVAFGLDPAQPHAERMKAKDMVVRHSVVGVLQRNQSHAIRVQQWRCAMVRNRNANCMRCAQACTSSCIGIENGMLVVDESKCVGCGTCATACPTSALEACNPNDQTLLEECLAAAYNERVSIVCHPVTHVLQSHLVGGSYVEVACLGRVDEALLVELAAQGVREIVLSCGVCGNCEQAPGKDCAVNVVETTRSLLDAWNVSCSVVLLEKGVPEYVLTPDLPVASVVGYIEDAFATKQGNPPLRSEAQASSVHAATQEQSPVAGSDAGSEDELPVAEPEDKPPFEVLKVMADGTLPHFIPNRHERLLDSLAALGHPKTGSISTRLWGCVSIDTQRCVSCRMCATFCPTGAIMKYGEQDSDDFGVEHYPGDCVNCGTCQAICPHDAISISTTVQGEYILGGEVHRYAMLPRAVAMNNSHQIVNTMRSYIDGDIFER